MPFTGPRRKVVAMSFLGVGAPEALLVAVVALVVFGPKGLAEAAKSLGQVLRSFQPTIREVVEVSQEIKGTLEKEIGLDELRDAARPAPRPYTPPANNTTAAAGYTPPSGLQAVSDDMAKNFDPEIEAKRAASAAAAWGGNTPMENAATTAVAEAPAVPAGQQQQQQKSSTTPLKEVSALSIEELEAELARRKSRQDTA